MALRHRRAAELEHDPGRADRGGRHGMAGSGMRAGAPAGAPRILTGSPRARAAAAPLPGQHVALLRIAARAPRPPATDRIGKLRRPPARDAPMPRRYLQLDVFADRPGTG